MGKVQSLIKKLEKFIKDRIFKKTKTQSQQQQTERPQHYGAMLEEMVKLLPEKKHQRPIVFFKEYSQVHDQVPQKEKEPIYDSVTEEAIYSHRSHEGITKENFKTEEKKKEAPPIPPRRKLLQQKHTYENIPPKKEPIYDQVPGANKPVIPPKPKLTKEFLEEMKQKSHRQNQQKQQSNGPLNKQHKER